MTPHTPSVPEATGRPWRRTADDEAWDIIRDTFCPGYTSRKWAIKLAAAISLALSLARGEQT